MSEEPRVLPLVEDDQDVLDRQASPRTLDSQFTMPRYRRAVSDGSLEVPKSGRSGGAAAKFPLQPEEQKQLSTNAESTNNAPPPQPEKEKDLVDDDEPLPIKPLSAEWVTICVFGLMLTVAGLVTAILTEIDFALWGMKERNHEIWHMARWTFAGVCIFVAVPVTHGLGGRSIDSKYSFFQPFVGGTQFVLLQIIGWTFYGLTILFFASLFWFASMRLPIVNGLLATAGIGGLVSQACVLLSLRYFDSRRKWYSTSHDNFFAFRIPNKHDFISFIFVGFLYQIPLWIAMFIGIVLFWGQFTGLAGLAVAGYLYSGTYKGNPHQTGARVGWLRYNGWFWDYTQHYFSFELIGPSNGKLDPAKKYLFGFHPHGIYPLTTLWSTRGRKWIDHVGPVVPEVLGASVMFFIPILRDLVMSAGCRDVSRKSIELAFNEGKSVLLIPGGEREMRETRPESKEIVLIKRHKGFVRMALMHGAALVPLFSFGEHQILDNFRQKSMQEWFQKRTMYGFPHLPYGRWYSPIPNPVPVTMVVGNPIELPEIADPSEEEVEKWHKVYFDELVKLFDERKLKVRSFETARLCLRD
eukprot:TRINITY_DN6096_c0_g3_i1.p1 TRINITY_DN6096_c0_g3~~TRINITY_DN6096_c0_g3_i1.p1  ORF type:complete len:588 (-),score=129.24 TRINITY_DN6096_c0_g3_i1:290-2032(-)